MENSKLLSEIISQNLIETLFQPIADLKSGEVIGYEAFSRGPEGTELYMPLPLISQAKCYCRIDELDQLLSNNALRAAKKQGIRSLLFLNLCPEIVYDEDNRRILAGRLEEYQMDTGRIVIEFSVKSVLSSLDGFIRLVEEYRRMGFRICLDNVGSSFRELFPLSKMKPDFVKIDQASINHVEADPQKQSSLDMDVMLTHFIGAKMIAVGVETPQELEVLIRLGVGAAQGMLIGAPGRELGGVQDSAKRLIAGK